MTKTLKIATVGVLAAVGLTTAAVAQQADSQMPAMTAEQHGKMMSGDGKMSHDNMMTADPAVRKRMAQMMENCEKMMTKMGDKSAPAQK